MIAYCDKLLLSSLELDGHLLHVVVDPVEHCSLVYDHGLQVFEDVCELDDSFGYPVDLSLALFDCSVVASEVLHGCLLQG